MSAERHASPVISSTDALSAFRLDGKLAVITGGSRGIGHGCATLLAAAGADIAILARGAAELQATAAEVAAAGRTAYPLVCDVTDPNAVAIALAGLPRIDVLVNSAGGNRPQPFLDVDAATYDQLFDLNMKSTFFVTQAVVRHMVEEKTAGAIVHITSQAGHVALKDRSVYCATKHAVEGFSKTIAVELAPLGIRVNTVAPTFVLTPMVEPYLKNPGFAEYVRANIPLGGVGRVEDVATAVLFLASPASALVTGTSIRVDGGWTAQ
jgi:NAD(P)-dependent dehydrogenase (short-subunit alcohol dehydrogenase family)